MNRKQEPVDFRRTLRRVHVLFYGGLAVLGLTCLAASTGTQATVFLLVCLFVGAGLSLAGGFLAWARLRCPYCGAPLLPGGKVPGKLPRYCANCGERL